MGIQWYRYPIDGTRYFTGSSSSSPSHLTVFNNRLYFNVEDDIWGNELWEYDGINAPFMIKYIFNHWEGSEVYLTVFNNKMYFQANDGVYGTELWEYDGTNAPFMVHDIFSGPNSSSPTYLTVFNNKLYFQAIDGTHGPELWRLCPQSSSSISISACESYFSPSGIVYTISDTYTDTIPNTAGCDSIITIYLTINNNSSTDVITACDSYTWINGTTYNASNNTATRMLTNTAGCDSLVTLDLTINTRSLSSISETINTGSTYTAPDGSIHTLSGIYTAVIENATGCDSIITINLSVVTGINSISQSGIKYYPNPVDEQLSIVFNESFSGTIELVNISGQVLYIWHIKNREKFTLYMRTLPEGIYIVNVFNKDNNINLKVYKN